MILRVAEKEEPQKEQQTWQLCKKRDPFWDGQVYVTGSVKKVPNGDQPNVWGIKKGYLN